MDLSDSLPLASARIERERRTIQVMVEIYCHKKHGTASGCLCPECAALFDYALQRIEKCPFREDKPTCRKCSVHCYKREMREQVIRVMAFSGPWMMVYHPVLTIQHYWDEWDRGQKISNTKVTK